MSTLPEPPTVILATALSESRQDLRVGRVVDWLVRGGQPDQLWSAVLTALTDPTAETRRRAVGLVPDLPDVGTPGRQAILTALADPVWSVREAAALTTTRFTNSDATIDQLLIELTLHDSHPLVRRAAAVAVGPRIVPGRDYGLAIRHPFERQRIRAATALGYVATRRAEEAAELLAAAIGDSHPKVRQAALAGLVPLPPGVIGPFVPTVVRKCAEANPRVSSAARQVWERFVADPAGQPLLPLLPFIATVDEPGLLMVLAQLPALHPLREAWASMALPTASPAPTRQTTARLLARLCNQVLVGSSGSAERDAP